MTSRAGRAAGALFVFIVVLTVITAVMTFARPAVRGIVPVGPEDLGYLFSAVAAGAAGALVAHRQPGNRIWMALCANGVAGTLVGFVFQYAIYAVLVDPGTLPGAAAATWIGTWMFAPVPVSIALILLLFPTGHPVTPRWRPALLLVPVALIVYIAASAVSPGWPQDTVAGVGGRIQNPLALRGMDGLVTALNTLAGAVMALLFLVALASIAVRYRLAGSQERHQLRWFLFVAPFVPLGFALYPLVSSPSGSTPLLAAGILLQVVASTGLPVAIGIAILKYRLYDIDLVISRTLVYGALALFVTAVYVAIVVGIGAVVGSGGRPNLALSVLATAVVAIAFQPAHLRLQRLGNRVVYGRRATPY